MDTTGRPPNSRVIVECTDPSNLLSTFKPLLSEHLPLRSLHWKSPNRPLRSIETLHVGITEAEDGKTEIVKAPRRHQIPGLRQTPYVKIYLLRCDDNETYKETCRKQIRQWIKTNAHTSDSKTSHNNQEEHDAFEWLIVHVVLPDTLASSQPRTLKHHALGTTDSTDSVSSKSKWPGKSSSTLYEKLRADFNSSSKSSIDRVAQVRIYKADSRSQSLPPAAVLPESEDQWDDLIEKLKVSILSSFHSRVAQYEEDIRERDAQRSLPGWNFCTFFILKEGLAQGFENVGLLEDASIVYDELALGLDVVAREQASQEDDDEDGSLLPFSKDLKSKIRLALEDLHSEQTSENIGGDARSLESLMEVDSDKSPFNTQQKSYRDLILANEVSLLDFRIYLFTRQLELLLRRANASLDPMQSDESKRRLVWPKRGGESLLLLAEICERGIDFINLAARCLRRDLYNAWGGQEGLGRHDLRVQKVIIGNIVSSWSWYAIIQILSETSTSALSVPDQTTRPKKSAAGWRDAVRNRTSAGHEYQKGLEEHEDQSVTAAAIDDDGLPPESFTDEKDEIFSNGPGSNQTDKSGFSKPGAEQLSSLRAELFLLARNTIENVTWGKVEHANFDAIKGTGSPDGLPNSMEGQSVDDNETTETEIYESTAGLEPGLLKHAAVSKSVFVAAYEMLTDIACRHFLAAQKVKSTEKAMIDLAMLKYRCKEYESAADYFEQVASLPGSKSWNVISGSILEAYSHCLKQLGRKEDYLECLLILLSLSSFRGSPRSIPITCQCTPQEHLTELLSVSKILRSPVRVPLTDFFELSDLKRGIRVTDGDGRFSLSLSIRLLFQAELELPHGLTMTLTAINGGHPASLIMKTIDAVCVNHAIIELKFESNCVTSGWYELRKLEIIVENIFFLQDFQELRTMKSPKLKMSWGIESMLRPILIYPAADTLRVKAIAEPFINIARPRQILIELHSAKNSIGDCHVRFKAATAGLRLRLHEAELISDNDSAPAGLEFKEGQGLWLQSLKPSTITKFTLPYMLDNADVTEIEAKVEVSWATEFGRFFYYSSISISTILQISVNVHDMFKDTALYSRFSISPATLVPLRLWGCRVEGGQHSIEHGSKFNAPVDVFPKQPASWVCKFGQKLQEARTALPQPPALVIDFESVDEMILSAMEFQFLDDIQSSACSDLSYLLCSHLLEAYRTKWTEQDLEIACLSQEVEVWSFEEVGWLSILDGLDIPLRQQTKDWLQSWHQTRSVIDLTRSTAPARCISIPVELPSPRFVITASVDIKPSGKSSTALAVGHPVVAELVISHTAGWRSTSDLFEDKTLGISFEIISPPELWLIGGSRKGTFTVDSGKPERIPLLLLPQRPGYLMLPVVEAKCFVQANPGNHPSSADHKQVPCELDYKGQAKSVFVGSDERVTTVTLAGEATRAGGSWIISSEIPKQAS